MSDAFGKLRLYTADGQLVQQVTTHGWKTRPDVIAWGARTFVWREEHGQYREGFQHVLIADHTGESAAYPDRPHMPIIDDPTFGAEIKDWTT